MRILSITAQKPSDTGSGVFLAETVASFARAGHTQAVVYGAMPDDTPFALDDDPGASGQAIHCYPVHFATDALPFPIAGMSDAMPYESTRYRDFTPTMLGAFKAAFQKRIACAVAEFAPDLIVCHHLYIVTAIAAQLGAPCPVVGICHGTDIRQMEQHELDNVYVREGIAQLAHIFALTAPQAEQIAACYGVDASRISVLGTGYNAQVFKPPVKTKPHAEAAPCAEAAPYAETTPDATQRTEATQQLLFVGKVCEKKGVASLIRAVNLIDTPDASRLSLCLVGGHNDETDYARIAAQAHASAVPIELPGKISQEDLIAAYQRSKVFVLPSFFEGLPLVLIEAMACGCVAVSTDLPGIRPWLADAAPDAPILFVKPPRMRNVDEPYAQDLPRFEAELARAIARACTMSGKPEAVAHLSWDALVVRLLDTAI